MKFHIDLYIVIDGNRLNQSNTFYCDRSVLVARVSEWFRKIKYDTGYRETVLESVMVNREFDIAEEVRRFRSQYTKVFLTF
jgi:hypothetical protein